MRSWIVLAAALLFCVAVGTVSALLGCSYETIGMNALVSFFAVAFVVEQVNRRRAQRGRPQ